MRRGSRPPMYTALLAVVVGLAALAVGGMLMLWPRDRPQPAASLAPGQTVVTHDAAILSVEELPRDPAAIGFTPDSVDVEITAKLESTGERVTFVNVDDTGELFAPGQRVRLEEISTPGQPATYVVTDFRRDRPLLMLTVLFVAGVLAFGRFQGLRALVGLALTMVVIVGFVVPAILGGRNPVLVALVAALAVMLVTLYLSHGRSRKTTAAVVGTALALGLTGTLSAIFIEAAEITGLASEEARLAYAQVGGLSLRGLLLAGIVLGGLGVLDDVTISQSSTVFALRLADPRASFGRLVARALAVGRDHVAATINTLFLAYAGAALPLLILLVTGDQLLTDVLTSEIVAAEVIRALVGSLGLIAAVPLTTVLAAALALDEPYGAAEAGPPSASALVVDDEEDEDDWVQRLREAYGHGQAQSSSDR